MSFIDIIKAILIFFYEVGEGMIMGAIGILGFIAVAFTIIFVISFFVGIFRAIKEKIKKE